MKPMVPIMQKRFHRVVYVDLYIHIEVMSNTQATASVFMIMGVALEHLSK